MMSESTPAPDAPDEESDYEVDFTSEQATVVICKRCSKVFPPGTKLRLMHSKTQGGSDRFFCSNCYEYYRSKRTTVRRTTRTQGLGTSNNRKGMQKSYFCTSHFSPLLKSL